LTNWMIKVTFHHPIGQREPRAGRVQDAFPPTATLGSPAEEARRRLAVGEEALAAANLDDDARDELVALGRFIVTRES